MKKLIVLSSALAFALASCAGNPEGEKAETTESVETSINVSGESYLVDAQSSQVIWKGTKVTGAHEGTITIKSGELYVDNSALTGGNFVLDMNSINTTDLEGEWKEKLDGHLKNEDFFATDVYPEASFQITSVSATATEGVISISGNLTIKGITKNITFNANVEEVSATKAKVTADFNIEREDWGVNYKGKEDDLISKQINFKVSVVANK